MDDVCAVAKIDELRDAARSSMAEGDARTARRYLENASDIAEHNLICPETLSELADALEAEGRVEASAECRAWYGEFTGYLEENELLSRGYEDLCRRAANAHGEDASGGRRESLADTLSAAREASCLIQGNQPISYSLSTPEVGRKA